MCDFIFIIRWYRRVFVCKVHPAPLCLLFWLAVHRYHFALQNALAITSIHRVRVCVCVPFAIVSFCVWWLSRRHSYATSKCTITKNRRALFLFQKIPANKHFYFVSPILVCGLKFLLTQMRHCPTTSILWCFLFSFFFFGLTANEFLTSPIGWRSVVAHHNSI